ncbi:ShlB/FhaC/HecB family hemolysin secretion/activation protein [Exilibacterium tricleocarpae]|uniref:ShlB/FhaC/HecB family hemolysin secretion/activation protein n=1 Tax=Exilibacterium tricleocarpae TaxID=2591008 RepID=UPI0015D3E259|nr:ShlB/FhaC/HecB family hemolysin secretion/activation protein [Exilibacterium tricleocarpae]
MSWQLITRLIKSGILGLLLYGGWVCTVAAQAGVDPSRVDERVRPRADTPDLETPVVVPSTPSQTAPKGARQQKFQITGVLFDWQLALPEGRLQALADQYTHRDITLADVYELAARVTAAYRDAGYILTRAVVPAQRISDGRLRLQIVEGFIDKVEVEGDAGGALSLLLRHAQRLTAARPLTAAVLERELLLAGDITGLSLRSVLTPSEGTAGAASLTLVVDRKAFDGYIAADNFGSRYLGREELMAVGYLNDVLGTAGRLGLTGVMTPDGDPELAYGAISFQQPLSANGLSLFTSYSHSRTRPELAIGALDTEGEAKTVRLELSYPFIRSRAFNLMGTLGLYGSDIGSDNILVDPVFEDNVRNINVRLFANKLDGGGGYNTAELTYTHGVTALGGSKIGDANLSRANAGSDYRRLNFEVTRHQPLGNGLALLVGLAGQTSFNEDLLASQELGFGGRYYGRAFDPAEITGEKGLAGKMELQWRIPAALSFLQSTVFYGAYENATVEQVTVLPGEQRREKFESLGIGARATLLQRFNIDFFVAKPFARDVGAEGDRNPRVFFSMASTF